MAKKKKVVAEKNKSVAKVPQSKSQHLFRRDKVEEKKKEGWKPLKVADERLEKILDRNEGDLVLMEK